MKKFGKIIIVPLLLAIFFLVGCGAKETEIEPEEETVRTFADWTNLKIFQNIPAMVVQGTRISKAEDYGGDTYIVGVHGTSLDDYRAYLTLLEREGYEKKVDNGEEGLSGFVYTSTYMKDKLALTVTYVTKVNITYIAASEKLNLSDHLFYNESYVADNIAGAKTTLYMPELHTYGDSYIIKMKNGHFLLIDGGMEMDGPYLFDYLETLVPAGEKPVVEGWFISHGHGDHIGPLTMVVKNASYADRISVEGVYYTEPSTAVCKKFGVSVQNVKYGALALKNTAGQSPKMYRPQTGQRYYFNDIVIDVLHTQEQLLLGDYENYFNDSSTWIRLTIDGQTFLTGGDASEGSINVVERTYDKEFLTFDLISVFHHGQNVYDSYVNHFTYKTALYPTFLVGSQTAKHQVEENEILQKNATECLSWGDGTKVLTFPYVVGSAKSLPMRTWIYHPDRKTPVPY